MNFLKNRILKMWILSKIRLWNCEFCQKWDFENVNFVKSDKMWNFAPVWINNTECWLNLIVSFFIRLFDLPELVSLHRSPSFHLHFSEDTSGYFWPNTGSAVRRLDIFFIRAERPGRVGLSYNHHLQGIIIGRNAKITVTSLSTAILVKQDLV